MVLVGILSWISSHNAIALVYAEDETKLGTYVSNVNLCGGSMAYTGAGKVFVFDGTNWNEMGA